ncbi:MAG: hypothetical protein WDO68_20390 [Gammaproteobacteria bacterium]
MRSFVRLALPAAGGVALLLGASAAGAQAWIVDPRIELQGIYNDNNRLSADRGQEIEVSGAALDALVALRKETQTNMFEATPHIRSSWFPDASSEQSTDYYFDLNSTHKWQRSTSSIYAGFADESVVTSDLLLADFPGVNLGQTVSGDSGRVSVRNRRRQYSFVPHYEFDWTERRHLTFDAHYVDTKYDNTLFEQIGYKDYGAGVGMKWNTSQRATFQVDVVASQFSPGDDSPDTTTTGVFAEWRMAPSTITNYYFRVGGNRAEHDATGTLASQSKSSFNGGAGVAWNFQTTRLLIDALRSTSPSSQGAIVNRDELRFSLNRDFSPRVTGFVGLRGIRTNGLEDAGGTEVLERKYYTGRTGFEWHMTRAYSIEGAYEYRWQKYEGDLTNASSNGVTLSVVYQPRRLLK